MATAAPDLTVRGEPVERVYGNFVDRRYVVNRRYQRKLIWTLEEKQKFIDSIIRGFPVPIILLAESAKRDDNSFEIIDGMQRLDAIVSFISNKYQVDGSYFDLNTIAVTKVLFDRNDLKQRTPVLDRDQCVRIASYLLPLSIYEFADEASVDDVFRRINSGGRQLSRQELRSAGSIGQFATAVRRVSAKVRGDDSASDVLRLNDMQAISITNKDLTYGINVDSVFWVEQGVLARDGVRQSRDEELVADLIAFMVSDDPLSSRTEFLDDFYGMGEDKAGIDRFEAIEIAIRKRSLDLVVTDFQRVLDQIRLTLAAAEQSFVQLIFAKPISPSPRYFQLMFLAFYELIIKRNLEIFNRVALIVSLRGSGDHVNVQEGGRWGADNRQKAVRAVVGMIQPAFGPTTSTDPALVHWVTQLQNLLRQSYTEQAAYDFKQGFLTLEEGAKFDEDSFSKILKTCVGIANIGKDHKGYVLVCVAENEKTAARVEKVFGVKCLTYDRFFVSGVEHEASALGKNLDQLFQNMSDRVAKSLVSEPLRSYLSANLKAVRYFEKTVYVFETKGQPQPSLYDGRYYDRVGAQLREIAAADFGSLFTRFAS